MKNDMKNALDSQLAPVQWTEADARAVRLAMDAKPARSPRRFLVVALSLAIMLIVTVAVAASQGGLLSLIQKMQYPDVDASTQAYIQTDAMLLETEDFNIAVPEYYYDGRSLRMIVSFTPKEGHWLLYPSGWATNLWQELLHMDSSDADDADTRRVQDLFDSFEQVYSIQLDVSSQGKSLADTVPAISYSRNFAFDPETCTLSFLLQTRFREDYSRRNVTLKIAIRQNDAGTLVNPQNFTHTLSLTAAAEPEVYVCTEPATFPEAGVRIDKLTLEVLPQDIYYTIDYTILEWKESSIQPGASAIWFRFYETLPEGNAPATVLSSGLASYAWNRSVDGMQYVQTGVLARSELHDTYYIAARDMGLKIRYESHTFQVHPVSAE